MTQQIHFITYGNHLYNNSKQRIHQEALNTGWFNSINICGPESLTESFTVEFKACFNFSFKFSSLELI